MKCVYINLDRQLARREQLEQSFANANAEAGVVLERFSAIAGVDVDAAQFTAPLSHNEAACFLSHRAVVSNNTGLDDHLFVLEDDAVFSAKTFPVLADIVDKIDFEWDIFYTDVSIGDPSMMVDLFKKRMDFDEASWIYFINLNTVSFAAASGYVINKHSISKIALLLNQLPVLNIHIDLYYRNLIHQGILKGFVAFPFLTSLSDLSEQSQIQPETTQYTEIAWNTFRKLVWIDRSIDACQPNIHALQAHFLEPEMAAYATILGSVLSKKFIPK